MSGSPQSEASRAGTLTQPAGEPAAEMVSLAPHDVGSTVCFAPVFALVLLSATHFLVDVLAGTVHPLWPVLKEQMVLAEAEILCVYLAWTISTSVSQLLFGLYADRRSMRWVIGVGPAAGLVCLSSLGLAPNVFILTALFVVGGLGIAAFHPETAAVAGSLLPEHRSRAMAVFAFSGYLGQSLGPYYSGFMTDRFGLTSLTWGVLGGGAILGVLMLLLSRVTLPSETAAGGSAGAQGRGKIPAGILVLLLSIGSLRIVPALGVPFTLAFILNAQEAPVAVIGAVQSAFMAGIGLGAMGCAAFVKRRLERATIWVLPLCAAPVVGSLMLADGWTLVAMVGLAGLLLGVTMPVYISYGQQLLPQSPRVASSITMGVSWGISGGLMALSFFIFRVSGILSWVFVFFALSCVLSSYLCRWLPSPEREGVERSKS